MNEKHVYTTTVEPHTGYSFRAGLERHIMPAGNNDRIVTKPMSDMFWGPFVLGFKGGFVARVISWLARNGIQEQTGSRPDETNIEGCVKGWGRDLYSSRVFDSEKGVDKDHLGRLIQHLHGVASKPGVKNGIKHVTPELLRTFFNSEQPFFQRIVDRLRRLRAGELQVGDRSGLLEQVPAHIDLKESNREYQREKSGLGLILKIVLFMLCRTGHGLTPLHTKPVKALNE